MKTKKNKLEWTVFAASLLLTLAVVGVLATEAMRRTGRPSQIRVVTGAPVRDPSGFRVPVRVRNEGEKTAEAAKVEVVLEREGKEVERAEVQFQFIPQRSEREGSVVFRQDPGCCQLSARVVGFEIR